PRLHRRYNGPARVIAAVLPHTRAASRWPTGRDRPTDVRSATVTADRAGPAAPLWGRARTHARIWSTGDRCVPGAANSRCNADRSFVRPLSGARTSRSCFVLAAGLNDRSSTFSTEMRTL